jgi:hypothetical protein
MCIASKNMAPPTHDNKIIKISELNKNDNFTSEITLAIFRAISLSTSYEDFQFET